MSKRRNQIYLSKRFFISLLLVVILFILGYSFSWIYFASRLILLVLVVLVLTDFSWLFFNRRKLEIQRKLPARLSLGDDNPVLVSIHSDFPMKISFEVIEELPPQFQKRDFLVKGQLLPGENYQLDYLLKPLTRGEYDFGYTNVYVSTILGFIQQRIKGSEQEAVAV